ncbi:helix-turn-helix domain-containing protein [Chromobacterium haemolyticum]|uniref:helix-turn-helix domain-containing protein n=1 Tax=Chromobacterium haemolyticum TaxID=394935 RepID=UPI001746E590|nr:helix-turn-helix transcriptional regulator [Chromobacterium haemolyticum]QOD81645.1 helix-turn-helix transcriptional regulator [Chromobacterium haemolyticum]
MTISERLRQERMRLDLTQMESAKAAGVGYTTYMAYEKGTSFPNAEALEKLYSAGFDVLFIVAGQRNETTLTQEAHAILNQFQQLDPRGQRLALGVMQQIHQNLSE